ncbi:MAG: Nif3-like dinuclear metal center hexameric protein [Oscillospiraceae bacterium]|nr:Nif3-like dinuclear metal center hexameric protein [Oscillospiraceae bacterium]
MTSIRDVYHYLDKIAPFQNAENTDNCGLISGNMDAKAEKILVALDVTSKVVMEAAEKKIDLIIAHHPLMYRPIQKIMSNDPLYSLIQSNINFIAIHTNLDVADGGTTDLMIERLGFPKSNTVLGSMKPSDTEFGKITELLSPISAKDLAEKCRVAFGCTVVKYVDGGKPVKRIGLCSGGGGDLSGKALSMGCDAYICGDLRWDRLVFAADYGLTLIDAGHFHTEDIFCEALVKQLQREFPEVQSEKAVNSVDVCKYVF